MTFWSRIRSWLDATLRRSRLESEMDAEVRFHLEAYAQDLVSGGVPRQEAMRRARIEFGGIERVKEEGREARGVNLVESLLQDLRYGASNMMRTPGFTAITVLTLALGIGATTAIFSAVNPILFQSLPYPDSGQIMMISDVRGDGSRLDVTFHTYREVLERSRSFEAVAVTKPWRPTLTSTTQPERLDGQRVSATYFRTLGISPALGRDFDLSDDQLNGPRVVILSDVLWKRRFAGDRTIVGRQVKLDDNLYTVIGVLPTAFENVLAPLAQLWSPLQYDTRNITSLQTREWGHHLRMVGRLRSGLGSEQLRRELDTIARNPVREFPRPAWASLELGLTADSLQHDVTENVRPALLAVLGAVLLVLIIACVNVTNLLLARGVRRRGEFALRAALGAGRRRLVQQLLTESLLLALMGGVVGLAVAQLGVRVLVALSPSELPRVGAIGVNGAVLAFALCVTTLIGLVVGLIPALRASRNEPQIGLQESSQRTAGGHQWARRALVVAEVALALVVLVSAGLLLRSLDHLFAIAPGLDPSHVLTMQMQASGRRFDDDSARYRFFAQALQAVRRVPGVKTAAFTSQLPLSGDLDGYGIQFEDDNSPNGDYAGFRYAVTPGYFETMGIPLRRGRLLDEHDMADSPVAVLISESLATRKFPGRDPLGQRVRMGPDIGRLDRPWYTIVGVVGDVKQVSLAASDSDALYITTTHWSDVDNVQSLVVRARGDAGGLAPAVRNAIWSVDKDQPVVHVATMDDLLASTAAERRFALTLFEAFALVALILAAAGIYGVLSGSVAERTREIGVRLALGASREGILALVVREGMTLTVLGVSIGLVGAAAASQAIAAMLFGISPFDSVTYLGVIVLLAGVAVIACGIPAWRAMKVDPIVALRYE
ncbi:MAG TPA: ABC transporter permease [Steroidobacteraceae bacterium]|nr:ABC transporter permease [Steroidobacteraceae bacterium]